MTELGWVHTAAAAVAIGAGAATLLRRKGTRSHRFLGHVYLWSMVALNGTAFMLRNLWGGWGPFHVAALASLLTLVGGVVPVLRRERKRWLEHHAMWMAWSYAGLMAAFASEIATRVPAVPFVPGVAGGTALVIGVAYYLINGGGAGRVRAAMGKVPDRIASVRPLALLAVTAAGFGVLAAPASVAGQVLPPPPSEMEALEWLEGEWVGTGWVEGGPEGRRSEFQGTERVTARMGGRVLVVEGEYTADLGPQVGEVAVHQALGVLSYDPRQGRYTFRTYTAQGGQGEAHVAEVSDGRIVWGYDDPRGGRVRYTITRTADGAWREVGHTAGDDDTWTQFFEMTLRRASP